MLLAAGLNVGYDSTQRNTFILPSREALELGNAGDTLPEYEVERTPISSPIPEVLGPCIHFFYNEGL